MHLSVIIPAFDDIKGVLTCLNSLQALATPPNAHHTVEYLVQDDASPSALFPAVIPQSIASTERNPVNMGFAGNVNMAAQRAKGDVLLIVNQDVFGVPGWSEMWDTAILNAFADPKVGIVGARLLFPNGSVQSCGGIFDAACQPYHRNLGWSNPHHADVSTAREVSWVTGAAFGIRRSLWDKLGGFDVRFRMYWEDVDACLRARELGYEVWYAPACTLIHSVGSTGGSPHFISGARRFKEQWVDSGRIKPDTHTQYVRYW